jgi:hypothetical protein
VLEALGWVATAVFSSSYFFRRQTALRLIQAAAACLWITYGIAIGARPVVVANLIVAAAAVYTSFLKRERQSAVAAIPALRDSSASATATESGIPV